MKSRELINGEKQKVLAIARHFLQCYLSSRDGLKELQILRSERLLQGDYAEWLVAQVLDLKLEQSQTEKAIDARDERGRTYQIKSRIVKNLTQNTSFDLRTIDDRFDFLVPVFFNKSFEVLAMLKVPYEVVRELGYQTSSTFRFRWNSKVATDERIEKIIWEDEISGC
ncbi:MAG: hypothetical protein D6715_14820 [Calditrichaeota bacterium]|nr:MAG: hypothetical protein D6715_14820 [Calditrichota bacterium]